MKPFPSISQFDLQDYFGEPCHVFYKYDGSNLRFEWSHKSGWNKFGTRTRQFDKKDEQFGEAIPMFFKDHAESLEDVIRKHYSKAQKVIVFAEFHGPKSFAGKHDPCDKHELTIIDVNVHKNGFVDPQPFINLFGHLNIAKLVYAGEFTPELVINVQHNTLPNVKLNEGVVVKGGVGHKRWLRKIKTIDYLMKLQEIYKQDWMQYV